MSEHKSPPRVLIVDDERLNINILNNALQGKYKIKVALNGMQALDRARSDPQPEIILLDIMMPDMDGYEVCEQLKADKKTKNIPVVFMSALNEVFDKLKAFQAGGVDYIPKPFQVEEVLARVKTHLTIHAQQVALSRQYEELTKKNTLITEQAMELEVLASKDSLTGLSNRRDFQEKAEQEKTRFQRANRHFALILLDIDHFKNVNDTHGHDCGDKVLVNVSRALENSIRAQDVLARWGGEEFICLLPETEVEGAKIVAEKIRITVEDSSHDCADVPISVTVTLGICVYDGSCSMEECIRRADDALYKGKNKGRNQVVVCG